MTTIQKTPEYENIEIDELNDLNLEDFSFADPDLQNKKSEDVSKKGEDMSDDFFELDSLNEQDLIEALSGSGISNVAQTDTQNIKESKKMEISNNNIDIGSSKTRIRKTKSRNFREPTLSKTKTTRNRFTVSKPTNSRIKIKSTKRIIGTQRA